MKEVIFKKFKAFTGKLFDSEEECLIYEKRVKQINNIMSLLNPIPNDINFCNGGGYIQQNKINVEKAKEEILKIGRKLYSKPDLSFYWLGRYADDSNDRDLYSSWGRLSNIDFKYREWGQGYFAINPDKGIQEEFKS